MKKKLGGNGEFTVLEVEGSKKNPKKKDRKEWKNRQLAEREQGPSQLCRLASDVCHDKNCRGTKPGPVVFGGKIRWATGTQEGSGTGDERDGTWKILKMFCLFVSTRRLLVFPFFLLVRDNLKVVTHLVSLYVFK
jgi:hypothetical protein